MSENYCSTDGYKPMVLPAKGEDLLEGRQYLLTPLARLILQEEYGIRGVPTVVECTKRKVAATRMETTSTNLETGEVRKSLVVLEPQRATFRAFMALKRVIRFELDIAKLEEFAPMYDKSHKLPALEEDWFAQRSLPSTHHKFRGQSLRFWSRPDNYQPRSGALAPARIKSIDLSILDL